MSHVGCLLLVPLFVRLVAGNLVLIRTDKGLIRGRKEDNDLFIFEGIPYAQPPVRFQASESHLPWTGVRNTTTVPPPCSQPHAQDSSEDCLFLSVHTPKLGAKAGLPVWVWIHGGDFSRGSIASEGSPRALAREGIAIVIIQYRLGPFGFAVFEEDEENMNLGFSDQVVALDWVKRNIRRFGGDADRIILGGSGAGGHSASRLALKGDYAGLIVSSSGISKTPWITTQKESALEATRQLGLRLSCSSLQSLRKCLFLKSVEDILDWDLSFHPVEDASEDLQASLKQKTFPKGFSLLIGDNSYDEDMDINSRLKMYLSEDSIQKIQITSAIYDQIVWKLFPKYPSGVHKVISYFYRNQSDAYLESILNIITDAKYKCPVDSFATLMSQRVPVYRYTLSQGPEYGGESSLLFSSLSSKRALQDNSTLSQFMTSAWSNFIKFGDPTHDLLEDSSIGWPKFTEPTQYKMLLSQDMLKIVSDKSQEGSCSFWNELIPDLLQSLSTPPCSPKTLSLVQDNPQVRSLPTTRQDPANELLVTHSKDENEQNPNNTVVSYKLNVLNSPYKMLYHRPGNSPIFISSEPEVENSIQSNEVSESVNYFRLRSAPLSRDYYREGQSQGSSPAPIYDPFHHQLRAKENAMERRQKSRNYEYYPSK